jgi:hypothetical protein
VGRPDRRLTARRSASTDERGHPHRHLFDLGNVPPDLVRIEAQVSGSFAHAAVVLEAELVDVAKALRQVSLELTSKDVDVWRRGRRLRWQWQVDQGLVEPQPRWPLPTAEAWECAENGAAGVRGQVLDL